MDGRDAPGGGDQLARVVGAHHVAEKVPDLRMAEGAREDGPPPAVPEDGIVVEGEVVVEGDVGLGESLLGLELGVTAVEKDGAVDGEEPVEDVAVYPLIVGPEVSWRDGDAPAGSWATRTARAKAAWWCVLVGTEKPGGERWTQYG